jgi:hypothetical protein
MSKLQHINIVQEFDVPVAQLFAKLSEHEYTITSKGGPIKDHYGTMTFIDLGNRSRLEYHIQFAGRLPLVGLLVKLALQDGIQRGLKKMRF